MTDVRVIVEPAERYELPVGPDLHKFVRASVPRVGNMPPPAFEQAAARVAALEQALEAERQHMHGLMRAAYEHGVPQNTIARWTGFTPRWVSDLLRRGR